MVDYKYKDLFWKSHVDNQLKISSEDGEFKATNSDIHWEDFELTESLCSESEIRFGSCEPNMIKFQIRNAFIPLVGKWLIVEETLDGKKDATFLYGRYKVYSDKPTADREYRDISAYDSMYDIINADVSEWYNRTLPAKDSEMTMKQFREIFIRHFGLTEVLPKIGTDKSGNPIYGLANDGMTVKKTIEPTEISGKDVITAICEINGCFGHIGRDGKFHYIYLPQNIQGLYPANDLYPDHAPYYLPQQQDTGHLYPQDPKGTRIGSGLYIKCQYEDYMVKNINKLQIRQEENDIGCIYGDGENCYIVEDNFLVYGKSVEELEEIAANLYSKISDIVYRPFSAECIGNPCFEVGDPLKFLTKYEIVETYLLSRRLKGIQGIRDMYSAEGTESRSKAVNSVQKSIVQLKGKTNTLIRNVDETRSELKDTEKNLRSTIAQTAEEIRLEVENGDKKLSSEISQTATEIRTEVNNTEQRLSSEIKQNADSITAEVVRAKDSEARLELRADGIVTSVRDLRNDTESEFRQVANRLSLKVESGEVQSMIDVSLDKIVLRSDQIQLEGYTTINGGFSIDEQGNATISSGNSSLKLTDGDLIIKEGSRTIASIGGIYGNKGIYLDGFVVARSENSYLVFGDGSGTVYAKNVMGSGKCDFPEIVCSNLTIRSIGDVSDKIQSLEEKISDLSNKVSALESSGGGEE